MNGWLVVSNHYIYIYPFVWVNLITTSLFSLTGIMVDEWWMFMVDEWFWRPMDSCAKKSQVLAFSRPGCRESGVSHFLHAEGFLGS